MPKQPLRLCCWQIPQHSLQLSFLPDTPALLAALLFADAVFPGGEAMLPTEQQHCWQPRHYLRCCCCLPKQPLRFCLSEIHQHSLLLCFSAALFFPGGESLLGTEAAAFLTTEAFSVVSILPAEAASSAFVFARYNSTLWSFVFRRHGFPWRRRTAGY